MDDEGREKNPAGSNLRLPTIEQVAEWSVGKLVTRYVVPALLALGAWLGPRYIEEIVKGLESRIEQVSNKIETDKEELELKIKATQEELRSGRERNITVQTQLTQTLADTQRTLAAQQATAQAQYEEVMRRQQDTDHRFERLEDRLNGTGRPR